MLEFDPIDSNKIVVTVTPPDEPQITEDEIETRELGNIIKTIAEEYEFHTTPQKYLHALWWIKDGDLELLKEKLIDLNSA